MLICTKRAGVVIRIPSVALMLAGAWGFLALVTLSAKHSRPIPGWFAVVVATVFILGIRIVRRVGDDFVVTGLRGSEHVPARHAVLGVRMQGGGRYWHLALDLMAHPDFGSADRVEIDSFQPNGTEAIMLAARRAASALGLPEPSLAPGLVDGSSGALSHAGVVDGGNRPSLGNRWAATSSWSKFLVLTGLVSVGWLLVSSLRHPGARLELRCAEPWHVRDSSPTFNYTCQGRTIVDVDDGPATLAAWDPDRRCWIERKLDVVQNHRMSIDVDAVVKTGRCSTAGWPPP
ncbi:MAG TPA: hypothetical protein VHH90_04490 [Polyangia bacterium]|nr:hypothetical protein [Polyangia bacterium]